MALEEVARMNEISEGEMMHAVASNRDILLAKVEGTVYAIDDHCGHLGTLLHEGTLDKSIVTCPGHNVHYEVTTGKYVGARDFTNYDREAFTVMVEDGIIKVDVPERDSSAG